LKPPGLTFVALWHPAPLQSRLPIGMCEEGVVTTEILANVLATVGPWQLRHSVTPW